jgi:hypothetical protein
MYHKLRMRAASRAGSVNNSGIRVIRMQLIAVRGHCKLLYIVVT